MPDTNRINPRTNPNPITLKSALDKKRDVLLRMPESDVFRTHRLDASAAASIVIGSLPRIVKHRDAIAARFGDEGVAVLDDLPILAYATQQADIELTASDTEADLSAKHAEVMANHQLLVTDADALANRGLLDRSRIDAGRPVMGYRMTVTSTLVLVSLFRERWEALSEKTPLTVAELDAIERRAQRMLEKLNERDQGSNRLAAFELRTRAISHLVRGYGEMRRMLTYVRWWEEDADEIAPSLWSGRRGGRIQIADGEIAVTPPAVVVAPDGPVVNESGPITP